MKFREIRKASEEALAMPQKMNQLMSAMFVAILFLTAAVITLAVTR